MLDCVMYQKNVKAIPVHVEQAHRRGAGKTVLSLNYDARKGWVVSATPWPL